MSVVLMYHALHPDGDVSAIDREDQPYAVPISTFKAHMAALRNYRVGVFSANSTERPDVVITFDDGHLSNYTLALPVLEQLGFPAYFFVTTNFIESRANHCRPQQLKNLVDAGMVVGSHGVSHQFLADLTDTETKFELRHSRDQLQSWINTDIHSFSFPGGRYTEHTLQVAQEAGYRQIFDSKFDVVLEQTAIEQQALARVAIRRATTNDEFERMISKDSNYFRSIQRTQKFKQSVKRALGNRLYHGLYKSLTTR